VYGKADGIATFAVVCFLRLPSNMVLVSLGGSSPVVRTYKY